MKARQMAAALTLLCVAPALVRGGEPAQVRLAWGELAPRVTSRKIELVLPDGAHIAGKVRGVELGGLRLKVDKTSDRHAQPKGERVIPRDAVTTLRVTEYRKLGRLLVTLGAAGAAGGILAASYPNLYEGTALIAVPVAAAAGITGIVIGAYYAGKRLDRRITEIQVTP